ncbi:MAG: SecY-interacting protein Syd [Clostridium sp.]|nr:SecY-interacting protein Syd [Clostridium sp.]
MELKEKMKKCFGMQLEFWQRQFDSYPKTPYVDEFENSKLYINDLVDEEGYIEWQPKEQVSLVDDKIIEKKIGIKLNLQLIEFYSSYCFLELIGRMDSGIVINFDRIPFGCNINEYIVQKYISTDNMKEYHYDFNKYQLFEIGSAIVDGNDAYLACFDNYSGKVLLVYFVEGVVLDLNMSLCDIFDLFVEVY